MTIIKIPKFVTNYFYVTHLSGSRLTSKMHSQNNGYQRHFNVCQQMSINSYLPVLWLSSYR